MPYCTRCGTQTGEADVFCSNCGAKQAGAARGWGVSSSARLGQDPLAGLSPRTAAILCYIPTVGWIAAVVVLAARKFKADQAVRFHAFQGLYLFAAWLMVQWVIRPLTTALDGHGLRVDRLLEGVLLGVSIFMMIKASRDEAYVLPIIGELAQRSAAEQ